MSELNITEMLNQTVLEFGNERFLEGWNGQQERIIKLLEENYPNRLAGVIALIKGEK